MSAKPERSPPHDLAAEEAVLATIFADGIAALDAVRKTLDGGAALYSPANRLLFEAACALADAGTPVDSVTVGGWIRSRDRLAEIGGVGYLAKIADAVPYVANLETHAAIVTEKARVREMISTCQRISAEGYGDVGDVRTWLDDAEASVFKVVEQTTASDGAFVAEPLKAFFAKVSEASAAGRKILGTSTGYHGIDDLMSGLHDGDLTILAARPGMGKTSLALCLAINVAAGSIEDQKAAADEARTDKRPTAAFFSLEMPRDQLAAKMACSEGRVDVGKVRKGLLNQIDWQNLTGASQFLEGLSIWIDDQADLTIFDLRSKCRQVAAKAPPDRPLRLVVVDYLQLMRPAGRHDTRDQAIGEISRGLKQIAKELKVPVIALSQLNRSVETRSKDKRPQLSDLRESGNIEQDADNILFVYRDEYYNKDSQAKGIAEIIVAKQRNGPTGKVALRFLAACTRFDNFAPGEIPEGVDLS